MGAAFLCFFSFLSSFAYVGVLVVSVFAFFFFFFFDKSVCLLILPNAREIKEKITIKRIFFLKRSKQGQRRRGRHCNSKGQRISCFFFFLNLNIKTMLPLSFLISVILSPFKILSFNICFVFPFLRILL